METWKHFLTFLFLLLIYLLIYFEWLIGKHYSEPVDAAGDSGRDGGTSGRDVLVV